jgi:hypothetical protein
MLPTHATTPLREDRPHSVGYTLGALMLGILMIGLALAYGLGAILHPRPAAGGAQAAEPVLKRTLVGKDLAIPASWFRTAQLPEGGFASQVELELLLPLGRNGALRAVDVMLLPLSQVRPSASLLDGVYLHQFMPNELTGPPGLVGKPLYGTEGYQGETVWYDALSPEPFVAKCMAPAGPDSASRCLRTVALPGGIAAVYDFDAELLSSWRDFDPQMKTWLGRIGAL